MMRLIQVTHPTRGRRVGVVDGDRCALIGGHTSVYWLAGAALRSGGGLAAEAERNRSGEILDYDAIHFFGADAFSFGEGVGLEDGDEMTVAWEGFGRPLRNPVRFDREAVACVKVEPV